MNYYEILGVTPESSTSDIKKAYRKLAKKWHPDKSKEKDATEKFQKITAAYNTLKDTQKREEYDFSISNPYSNPFTHRPNRPQQFFVKQIGVTLEDLFNGTDIETPNGTIKIPRGCEEGAIFRIDENIYTVFSLPHKDFVRRGNDLFCKLQIPMIDLILGTKVKIKGVDGKKYELTVKEKCKPETTFRLSQAGMPDVNHPIRGDLYVVAVPIVGDISKEEMKKLKEIFRKD